MNRNFTRLNILLCLFVLLLLVFYRGVSKNYAKENTNPPAQKNTLKGILEEFGLRQLLNETHEEITMSGDDKKVLNTRALMFKSSYLKFSGNTDEAISLLKDLEKKQPDNLYIKLKIAQTYKEIRDYEKSLKMINDILTLNPKYNPALLLRAEIAEEQNKNSEAVKDYTQVLKTEPDNQQALERLLEYYFRDKADLDKTIEIGNKILLIDQRSLYTHLLLASTYSLKGDMKNAIVHVDKIIRFRPDLIWRIVQIGEVLQNNNQINESYLLFKHLFIKNPKNDQIRMKFEQSFYQNLVKTEAVNLNEIKTEAKDALEKKFSDEIIKEYKQIIKDNPKSIELQEVFAKKYYEINKISEAKETAKQILKTSPQNYTALVLLGQIYYSENNLEESLKHFQVVLEQAPEDPEVYATVSRIYQKQNDMEQVEKLLKNAYLMHPDNDQFCRLIANFYRNQGNLEEAVKYYEKLDETSPESVDTIQALLTFYLQEQKNDAVKSYVIKIENRQVMQRKETVKLIGLLLLNYKSYENAERLFVKLIGMDNTDLVAVSALSQIYNKKGKFAESDKLFDEAKKGLTDEENERKYYLFLGQNYYEQKAYQKSMDIFKEGLKKFPDDTDLYFTALSFFNEQKKYDEADALIAQAEKNISDKTVIQEIKASSLSNQKKYDEAVSIYEKLIEDNPENDQYYFLIAAVYFEMKEYKKAEDNYRKAIGISPLNIDALNNLGYMFAEQNINLKEAKELIERAKTLKPYAGYILDSLGWVYFKMGDYVNAQKYLERAYMLSEADHELCDHLYQLYTKMGNETKAKEYKEKSEQLKAAKEKE